MRSGKDKKDNPLKLNTVLLDDKNMEIYGFSRFYYPEEKTDNKPGWVRPISGLERDVSAGSEMEIMIPENLLIPLSTDPSQKLVRWKNFSVEETGDLTVPMKLLSLRAGWNQTDQDIKAVMQLAKPMNFLAMVRIKNKMIPLGSGTVLQTGDTFYWIGMILVHPEVRRQGIARAVMYHCLKQSRINKKECIIGLDATPEGKNLYGSLGFKTSFDITRCRIPVNSNIPASPDQKVEKFFHFEKIQDYLLQKGFGDRQRVFRVLTRISSGRCFLVRSGNLVKGFVLSRPGAKLPYIGPLIADEEETAGILLKKALEIWKAHNHKEVYMDIPSAHLNTFAGKKNSLTESWFLSKAVPVRKFNRMYQSISEDNKDQVFSLLKQDFDSEIKDIADMLDGSEASHEKTVAYMETEKNDLIRYQFAIGGPEFS